MEVIQQWTKLVENVAKKEVAFITTDSAVAHKWRYMGSRDRDRRSNLLLKFRCRRGCSTTATAQQFTVAFLVRRSRKRDYRQFKLL